MPSANRIFVLDTNVLMHDPTALFRFGRKDVYLPMMVLEELDAAKKGTSEVARNARQASRFLDVLIHSNGADIGDGIPLRLPESVELSGEGDLGRLYFETDLGASQSAPDNQILLATIALEKVTQAQVVLVTKDINLRIKAAIRGVDAQDYQTDPALDDLALLHPGYEHLPGEFWEQRADLESWTDESRTYYRVPIQEDDRWYPNLFLYIDGDGETELMVCDLDQRSAKLAVARDYRSDSRAVWGIRARNREQNFALNLLMDPNVQFVALLGTAGTGKTLLALAAGLAQTMDHKRYAEIIMTRATVPVGDDIGFLPGTEEEKMTPWMGALTDNLEVLTQSQEGGDWGRAATTDLLASRIKIRSLNFMRGRTFLNRFVMLDEAQNLTPKQMKTLLTRAGPGTKMVCLGNVGQIDTPYLTETTSGLTYVVDRFRTWVHSGHVTLRRGERSPLADYASEHL